MRKLSILALGVVFAVASCQKSSITPSSDSLNASLVDLSVAAKSNFFYLTSHTWWYVRYYVNYVDPNNPGDLAYRRGGKNNTINLDLNRVTFKTDGTVDEIDQNGNHVPGTWHFTNNEQTMYEVTNSYGTFSTAIDFISLQRFEWTGPDAHVHGIMTIDNKSLLTAHTWEYFRYFTGYTDPAHPGQLVYRRGRPNNPLNLDLNRVTFKTDGTVDEIDMNGTYIPGTWSFTNAAETEYQVTNSSGVHNTRIDSLSSTKFEWTGPDVKVHGSMISATN
jgi:hypothetical protein